MSTIVESTFELRGERSKLVPLLRDLWAARSLTRTLAKKDFFVRYRRASIGLLWAVGLPLVQALVMAVIFSRVARFHAPISFPVFVFVAVLPWTFFSGVIASGTTSIVDGANLATKIYFPRPVLPLVVVLSSFHGYAPALGIMLAMAVIFKVHVGIHLLLLIPATGLMLGLSAGFVLVFAALHVYFRDMRYIVQAALLPWFWASGVIFSIDRLSHRLAGVLEFNPAVGMIQLYRASFGAATGNWGRSVLIAVIWVLVLIAVSLPLYQRYDRVFIDLL